VIDVPTTIDGIEQRIAAKQVSRTGFLAMARISRSTWWRWKQGASPNITSWRRALQAAEQLE
jgi:hypothetical protein